MQAVGFRVAHVEESLVPLLKNSSSIADTHTFTSTCIYMYVYIYIYIHATQTWHDLHTRKGGEHRKHTVVAVSQCLVLLWPLLSKVLECSRRSNKINTPRQTPSTVPLTKPKSVRECMEMPDTYWPQVQGCVSVCAVPHTRTTAPPTSKTLLRNR